jgi:hypothetical protein
LQPKGIRQTSREQPTANETRSLEGGSDFKQFREEEAPSKLLIGKKRVQGCENTVNPPFSENEGHKGTRRLSNRWMTSSYTQSEEALSRSLIAQRGQAFQPCNLREAVQVFKVRGNGRIRTLGSSE